jgi:predicted ATP-dependent endonuclease of OLD family
MKIEKFRIRNYKSIQDSGDCYLDDKITILAGKNEAGKTVILEALEDFDVDKQIREEAIPLWDERRRPRISVFVKLDKKEFQKIKEKFEKEAQKIKEKFEIEMTEENMIFGITKEYPNTYILEEESLLKIKRNLRDAGELKEEIARIIDQINEKGGESPLHKGLLENPEELHSVVEGYLPQFTANLEKNELKSMEKTYNELMNYTRKLNSLHIFRRLFTEFVEHNYLPNFIFFKTFEDILPSQMDIAQAKENSLVKDLGLISDLDFDVIKPTTDPMKRKMHEERVNIKFSEEYKLFWTQDHSKLYISWDSNNIYFWIREGNRYYKPEIRSKGRQWHLAFYIKATARSMEDKWNLFLIDEPGLFLHAKAQRDILEKLERCSEKVQIIYTTHSPYSIPSSRLDRVRLVVKEEELTRIEKVTARADKETLTPILTAIGEDLSVGIKVERKNSIVVEGFSDYLYLNAFKKLLGVSEELNIVPATGGNTPVYVGSILFGWGLDPIFVLDNDKQGREVMRKLQERLSIDQERIILSPEKEEGRIESMFSAADFEKFMKPQGEELGKVLQALQFSQRVMKDEIGLADLTEDTKNKFARLFERIVKCCSTGEAS